MESDYFSRLKVLDFTGELGPYTGKMYAGLGANVIHVEPMAGNPLRRIGPFYKKTPGPDASLPFLYFNSGKRGVALNLAHEAGRKVFRELCMQADLLIESCVPGYLDRLGLSHEALIRDNPKLVHTAITPFGHSGAMSTLPASDLTCAALSGFLNLAGAGNDKPARTPDNQLYRMAEAYAADASAIALFHAQRTGCGQFVDMACIEAGAMALENAAQCWDLEGVIRRGRGQEAGTATLHLGTDGYIVVVAIIGKDKVMWDRFVQWMKGEGVEGWEVFDDDKWTEPAYRSSAEGYRTFCRIFEKYASRHGKLYLYETGQKYNVAVTPVSDGQDLLNNPQLRYRKFWQQVRNDALGGDVVYPGAPYEFGELQWRFGRNAPRLGEHTAEILGELGYSPADIDDLVKSGAVHAEQR